MCQATGHFRGREAGENGSTLGVMLPPFPFHLAFISCCNVGSSGVQIFCHYTCLLAYVPTTDLTNHSNFTLSPSHVIVCLPASAKLSIFRFYLISTFSDKCYLTITKCLITGLHIDEGPFWGLKSLCFRIWKHDTSFFQEFYDPAARRVYKVFPYRSGTIFYNFSKCQS
jgi:hypothetical protein